MRSFSLRLTSVFLFLFVILTSCGKNSGGGSGNTPAQEADLVVALNPEPSGGVNLTLTTEYKFNVVVQSTMPSQGVEIKVDYVKDSGGSVFSQTVTTTNASTAFTITNIPFNEVGTVTVVVTSRTKAANTVTKTFKLAHK